MSDDPRRAVRVAASTAGRDDLGIDGLDRVDFGHSAEMLVLTMVTGDHRRDV